MLILIKHKQFSISVSTQTFGYFTLKHTEYYLEGLFIKILILNKHFRVSSVKENIKDKVSKEADHYLGESMTFTLFEFLKDFAEELVAEQPDKEITESIIKLVSILVYYF